MRVSYAIVFVSDMSRSVGFYRDVVGLELRFESPHWTEFATEGATLALHVAEAKGGEADDPLHMPAARCKPSFAVADLDEFHARMLAKDVKCAQAPKAVFGVRIAQYVDPDGLGFSVSEARAGR